MNRSSIRHSIIFYFCIMVMLVALVFGFLSFAFLFSVEDEFIEREIYTEREYLISTYSAETGWRSPRQSNMQRYADVSSLPDDLRLQVQDDSRRQEFYGEEGRHYHIARLPDDSLLVAEVSTRLVIRQLSETIFKIYGVLLALLLLIGCVIAYLLAGRAVAPLTRLVDLVQSSKPEQLPIDFATEYPNNEVGTLAKTLQAAMDRTRRFISREQNFSRDVSHDLRTPIAVVAGGTEILLEDKDLPEHLIAPLERISVANEHMSRTVEALLSLAREESTEKSSVLLLPVVEAVVLQLSHQLDANQTELDIDVPDDARVRLQTGVLEILLANLLGNAVTYTKQGVIDINFQEDILTIADTGEGVTSELQASLLEPGTRGEHSSGFGLGLSIVKRLCEHHAIGLQIEHPERGTRVSLTFNNPELQSV